MNTAAVLALLVDSALAVPGSPERRRGEVSTRVVDPQRKLAWVMLVASCLSVFALHNANICFECRCFC